MNIEEEIRKFLNFVLIDDPLEDIGELMEALDRLAFSIYSVEYVFDEEEYPEAPEKNYKEIREKVQKRFPSLGFYNIAKDVSDNIEGSELILGDAYDDLSDIVGDLEEVAWCFENTSKNDALWHYENSYRSHWGRHLRDLQLYLHDRWW